jgi:choice-of-anchor A domain-containing protein
LKLSRSTVPGAAALAVALIALFSFPHVSYAQGALGDASNYNLYVLGNYNTSGSDTEGAVAVGGDFTFTAYSVNQMVSNGNIGLVVGGTLNGTGSTVKGNVDANTVNWTNPSVDGSINSNATTLNAYGTVSGNVTYSTTYNNPTVTVSGIVTKTPSAVTLPINFASTNAALLSDSSAWGGKTANGTTVDSYGTLNLTGTSNTLNVFDVNGSDLSSAYGINITAPPGSTVLVNVSGTSDAWGGGVSINGVSENDVIYNFYQATSLNIAGVGIDGSLLAPSATVAFNNGHIDGSLIAGNLTGNGQINYSDTMTDDLFSGALASFTVPEPAQTVTLAFGIFALTGLILLRRKKSEAQPLS